MKINWKEKIPNEWCDDGEYKVLISFLFTFPLFIYALSHLKWAEQRDIVSHSFCCHSLPQIKMILYNGKLVNSLGDAKRSSSPQFG